MPRWRRRSSGRGELAAVACQLLLLSAPGSKHGSVKARGPEPSATARPWSWHGDGRPTWQARWVRRRWRDEQPRHSGEEAAAVPRRRLHGRRALPPPRLAPPPRPQAQALLPAPPPPLLPLPPLLLLPTQAPVSASCCPDAATTAYGAAPGRWGRRPGCRRAPHGPGVLARHRLRHRRAAQTAEAEEGGGVAPGQRRHQRLGGGRAGATHDPEPSPSRARSDGQEPPRGRPACAEPEADPARARGRGQAAGPGRARQAGPRVRLLFPAAPQGCPRRHLASSSRLGDGRRLPISL